MLKKDFYDRVIDDTTAQTIGWQDNDTGELKANRTYEGPEGSVLVTPKEQERRRRLGEQLENQRARSEGRRLSRQQGGHYLFMVSEDRYEELKQSTMVRLVYLATFVRYNNSTLYIRERTPMKKADLVEVLQVSRKTADTFWKEVYDRYLFEGADGNLHISAEFFTKGEKPKEWYSKEYQTVFVESVRELYRRTPTSKHGKLGAVFQMLPYLNKEYNVLCWNPDEQDIGKIECMTLDDFCLQIGYATNQRVRLTKEYKEITFAVDGEQEPFCSFVTSSLSEFDDVKIYVNPRVIYKGSCMDRVRILGLFSKPSKPNLTTNLRTA